MTEGKLLVRDHFDATADAFDAIYSGRKSRLGTVLDRIFRRDMYRRYELTLQHCTPVEGKTVLDIGCGSGRYAIELAKRGAARVVGYDFADRMIALARQEAERQGVSNQCTFLRDDFMSAANDGPFDYVLAIGLFDYVRDFEPLLARMAQLTSGKLIATFPRMWTWRAPIRKLRLSMMGCPVYFFTRESIRAAAQRRGIEVVELSSLGKIFFLVGTPNRRAGGASE